MPAKREVRPEEITKLVEQNANAMRALEGQLQQVRRGLAEIQSRSQTGPPFQGLSQTTPTIGPQGASGPAFPTLGPPQAEYGGPSAFPSTGFGTTGPGSFPQSFPGVQQVPQATTLSPGTASQLHSAIRSTIPSRSPAETGLESPPFAQMAREKRELPPVTRQPTVDLIDHEDSFVLEADVPGVSKSDLDLTVYGNTLTIQAEVEPGEGEGAVLVGERLPTLFRRTLRLPAEVKPEEVQAKLKDGILTVTLPKQETGGGPHRIEIK